MDGEIRHLEMQLLRAKARIGQQPYVVIRTRSAGVHAGLLEWRDGQEATLTQSRRLWHWKGAATLSEVAVDGVDSPNCRFGRPIRVTLLEVIEVIETSDKGRASIEAAPVWHPNG